jgi:hypothetical protein
VFESRCLQEEELTFIIIIIAIPTAILELYVLEVARGVRRVKLGVRDC